MHLHHTNNKYKSFYKVKKNMGLSFSQIEVKIKVVGEDSFHLKKQKIKLK